MSCCIAAAVLRQGPLLQDWPVCIVSKMLSREFQQALWLSELRGATVAHDACESATTAVGVCTVNLESSSPQQLEASQVLLLHMSC